MHAVNLPPAILRFLQELPPPGQQASIQGKTIIAAWYRTVKWAAGQQWQKMHERMSASGRMHATTGIVVHSGQLGLFEKIPTETTETIFLGVAGQAYHLKSFSDCGPAVAYADYVLEHCRAADPACLRWPDCKRLVSFADALKHLTTALRTSPGPNVAHFKGGAGLSRKRKHYRGKEPEDEETVGGYLVKHFVRSVLLVADDEGFFDEDCETLDNMTIKALQSWLPDQTNSMQPVWENTVGWFKRESGISPFWASCHTCFVHGLSYDEQQRYLRASDEELWKVVQQWETWRHDHPEEQDCWPPMLGFMF